MKKIIMLSLFFIGSMVATIDDDFQELANSAVMVEKTAQATQGIDWKFELVNKDAFPAIDIKLTVGDKEILPGDLVSDEQKHFGGHSYPLYKGEVVRVAGLDMDQKFKLEVKNPDGKWIKREGQLPKNKTAFLVFENNQIKAVQKGFFSNKTNSGLSLNNNIEK